MREDTEHWKEVLIAAKLCPECVAEGYTEEECDCHQWLSFTETKAELHFECNTDNDHVLFTCGDWPDFAEKTGITYAQALELYAKSGTTSEEETE